MQTRIIAGFHNLFLLPENGSIFVERGESITKETGIAIVVSEKEKKLIELIRGIEFGELRIIIQEKQPVRVEEMKNSIKL